MREVIKKWWNSDIAVLLRRLAVVYGVMFLCRAVFRFYNADGTGAVGGGEIWSLLKGAFMFDTASVVYVYGVFILLSLIPLRVRERSWYQKILFWYFVIVTSFTAAVNLADCVYFHYTGVRLTAADTLFADNDNTVQLSMQFALENWYLVLAWAVMTVSVIFVWRYTGKPTTPIKNIWGYLVVNTVILACAGLFSVAMLRGGGLSRELRPMTMSNALAYTTSPAKANMILSNPFCIVRTISTPRISYRRYFEPEELASIFTPYHCPSGAVDAADARKNVVIFVLESFSAEHSALLNPGFYPDGRGFTPFLDSLMREGYYFERAYSNGMKSIDALPSILASIPSLSSPFVLMPQAIGENMPLPKILAAEGYQTSFFNGSTSGSMGFDAFMYSAGVEDIYSREDYDARYPGHGDFDGFWGIWDEPYLRFMGKVLGETRQPFFSTVFTISSHHPFNVPEEYRDVLPDGLTKIHKPAAYTDMALRRFFEIYNGAPWFANTIFVFCADHVSSETFAPETSTIPGGTHIISFIYTPDGSLQGSSGHVFQQADIMPTVLGMLGYRKPYFAFGRDVFNEPERMPVAVNYRQAYRMITDSLAVSFDGERILEAYLMSDTLQQRNIASPDDPAQQELQRQLEAFIQQYYTHVEARNYVVPEGGCGNLD